MSLKYIFLYLFTISFLFPLSSIAQDHFVVKGKVVDGISGQPLSYAMVFLVNKTTGLNDNGTSTDDLGHFELTSNNNNATLKIEYLGYDDYEMTQLNVNNGILDLGIIKIKESSSSIDEVLVIGERSKMEFRLDKRVFHVGSDIASTGVGALELLNNVPSVNVDIEGNISLRGNQGVQILIDGKPSAMSDDPQNALGTITADMIEKVEVITNPSAKYEAGGTSGILNIILKKEEKTGINGSISLNTGIPHNHNIGGSLNYRRQKFNFFTQFGGGYRSMPRHSQGRNINKTLGTRIESEGEEFRNEQFYNLTLGADYFINPYNTITLSGSVAYEIEDNPSEVNFDMYDVNDSLLTSYKRMGTTHATNPKYNYDLQYKKQFKNNKDHALLASAQGRFFGKDQESSFDNVYAVGTGIFNNQRINTDFYQSVYTYKLDYTNPLSSAVTLEVGGMYEINDVGNDYEVLEEDAGSWVTNSDLTNDFNYNQKVLGLYTTGSYERNKWGAKMGLRWEQTDLTTVLVNTNVRNKQEYSNLFPSLHISYKLTDRFSLQTGYSRRIFRPHLWNLNPFFNIQDNFNIRTGNPQLKPEFGDSYELSAIYIHDKWTLNSSLYHLFTTDVMERVSYFDNGVTISQPLNIGTNSKSGIEINGKYVPADWLTINGDFNYGFFTRRGEFENNNFDFSSNQWQSKWTFKFALPKGLDLEISPNYRSEIKTIQGKMSGFFHLDAGARKKLLKNRAILSLAIRDVFASRVWESIVDQPNFSVWNQSYRGRFVTLGFSYSFGKGEVMTYSGGRGR